MCGAAPAFDRAAHSGVSAVGKEGARRKTNIFLELVGSFFEAVAVPTRLAELIGGARQLPTSYPGEIVCVGAAYPRNGTPPMTGGAGRTSHQPQEGRERAHPLPP